MARTPSFSSSSRNARRHKSLTDDIISSGPLSVKSKKKAKVEEDEDRYVDSRASRKILKIGQDLIDDEEKEIKAAIPNPAFTFDSRLPIEPEIDDDNYRNDEEAWGDEDEETEEMVYLILLWFTIHNPNSD